MFKFHGLLLAASFSSLLASSAEASETGIGALVTAWLFGTQVPERVEEAVARPRVWTLHPSDRSRHPSLRADAPTRSYRSFPFHGRYFAYDGGPSRGWSYGVTTPTGAIIQQGRPSLSRGIARSRVSGSVRRAFR